MDTYSTNFARDPGWSGEGFSFVYVCDFDLEKITLSSVRNFFQSLKSMYEIEKFSQNWMDEPEISLKDLDSFLTHRLTWPASFWILAAVLNLPKISNREIEIIFYETLAGGLLSVGGPSYWFYHGSRDKNLAYAREVAKVVTLGVSLFGEGLGTFAADGYCEMEVEKMRKKGLPPNVTADTTCEELAEFIVYVCDDTRLRG